MATVDGDSLGHKMALAAGFCEAASALHPRIHTAKGLRRLLGSEKTA
jgi:hypothetical protein